MYIFIHYILTALCNLLGKLVNCLVYLHYYVLYTTALTIMTLEKIKSIMYKVIMNKCLLLLL